MKILNTKALSLILAAILFLAFKTPVSALEADSGRIEISLSVESQQMIVNGAIKSCQPPLAENGIIFVPAREVLEAIGAEVEWKGENRIEVTYHNKFIQFTIAEKKYRLNRQEREMYAPPRTVNSTTMVPLEFLSVFDELKYQYDPAEGSITIILEDDGALEDLSFLTGGINNGLVGDSHYGWSISVPKGSRIGNSSFNSRYILIENAHRGMYLEVNIKPASGKTLEQYCSDAVENAPGMYNTDAVDYKIYSTAVPAYGEFLYSTSYDEAVFQRVFLHKGNIYEVKLTSANENDPVKIKNNRIFSDIMQSFTFDNTDGGKGFMDISKIKFGLAKYDNYITLSNGKKYLSFEINVPPEWEILNSSDSSPYITKLGLDKKEYVSVEMGKAEASDDLKKYVEEAAVFQEKNFNPDFYTLIGKSDAKISGTDSVKLEYSARIGDSTYDYQEYYIKAGGFIYLITLKTPVDRIKADPARYSRILETLRLSGKESKELQDDLGKYKYNQEKNRLGKTGEPVLYESKAYGWKLMLPGYWIKSTAADTDYQSFANYASGGVIGVEALENTSANRSLQDSEKFRYMLYVAASGGRQVEAKELRLKGTNIRYYKYRIENQEEENFADVNFYIIEKGGISYCYMSALPDLCTSAANLKEFQDIWNSFEAAGKN